MQFAWFEVLCPGLAGAVVFAGSGSGKTVLLRRIIEECALQGVSAIVLDPNSDLARLGDGWPEPPPSWSAQDADRAREYLDGIRSGKETCPGP